MSTLVSKSTPSKTIEIEMKTYFPGHFDSLNHLSSSQKELIEKIKDLYKKIEIEEKNKEILTFLNEYFDALNSLKNKLEITQNVECFNIGFYLFQAYRAINKEIFIKTFPDFYNEKILPFAKKYIESFEDLNIYLQYQKVGRITLIEKIKKVIEAHTNFTNAVVKGYNMHHRRS
jgi:hypothetical protein